jgi:MFS family permease
LECVTEQLQADPVRASGLAGWPAVGLVGAAFAVNMLGTTLPTPVYPLYEQRYGFGGLVETVVFATYAVGVVAGLLVFGHWSDQVGRRPMLLTGLGFSALSAVSFVVAGPLALVFAGRLLSGLSAGIYTGTGTATLVDHAPARGKATVSLVAAAVNMGGLGFGPVLSGFLAQYAPWPLTLSFLVDLGLVLAVAAGVCLTREPVTRSAVAQLRPQKIAVPREIRAVFTRAVIAGFAGFAVLGLFNAVSPAFLGELLHAGNSALTGLVVLALFAASIVGQSLSSALGLRRALVLGCAGLIVGMVLVGASLPLASLPVLISGAVVAGLGQGMSFRAGLGSVTAASPERLRGTVTSSFFVMLYVGISFPVIGEGAFSQAVGLVVAGLAFAAVVAALAAVALVLLARGRGAARDTGNAAGGT